MKRALAFFAIILLSVSAAASGAEVIKNWSAPQTWMGQSSSSSSAGRAPLAVSAAPLPFIPVTPCRVADTRGNGFTGAYGPPSIGGGAARTFVIPGKCGIPSGAVAVSFNFAVWNTLSYGDFNIFPAGAAVSAVSTLNWGPGVLALANAAVIPLGTAGGITVLNESSSTVDLFFDVNGYYASTQASASQGTFYVGTPAWVGVWGESTLSTGAAYGTLGYALGGSQGIGVLGQGSSRGVWGIAVGGATGVRGDATSGTGVDGNATTGPGVTGTSTSSYGVHGNSTSSNGVRAESTNLDGLFASGGRDGAYVTGVRHGELAVSTGTTGVLYGLAAYGNSPSTGAASLYGEADGGPPVSYTGDLTSGGIGLLGVSKSNYAIVGVGEYIGAKIMNYNSAGTRLTTVYLGEAGNSARLLGPVSITALGGSPGNLSVSGVLSKGSGSFKIDHPLDPDNQYLYHSFVESPDMKNVYDGVVELDAIGSAVVPLPAYFEALNRDFRYQLTSIGSRQPGLFIDVEVANNQFVISGGKAYGRVSWQVTGIRKDAFANAHRIVPEVRKEPEFKGYYLHPAELGKPAERSLSAHEAQLLDSEQAKEALKAQETKK